MTSPKNEGLSTGYRIRWRVLYTLLFVLGPAQQSGINDPRERLRRERAGRVERARTERLACEGGSSA